METVPRKNRSDLILDKALELAELKSWENLRLHDIASALEVSLDEIRGYEMGTSHIDADRMWQIASLEAFQRHTSEYSLQPSSSSKACSCRRLRLCFG